MKTLAEKIRQFKKTPYETIAIKLGVSVDYVQKIANEKRTPKRGVGLQVLEELKEYIDSIKE